jgi:hypothetical protein
MRFCIFTLSFIALLFNSCDNKEYTLKVRLLHLQQSDIYDKDLVYDVIFDAEENNIDSLKTESRRVFLQGVDFYKNKKKPAVAVDLFKKSILLFPDAKTYYELGSALMDSKESLEDYKEAIKAFDVADHLKFQPVSSIYYKKACANGLFYNLYNHLSSPEEKDEFLMIAISNLRKAFENGFSDTLALKSDARIKPIVATKEYQKMVLAFQANHQTDGNSLFSIYSKSFFTNLNKLEIGLENVDMSDYKESISYDFAPFIPEMENTTFSRDVSHDYFYVAKLAETPTYTALVYSSISFYGEYMQPVHTTLAIYNPQGEIISKKLISCQCSAEKVKTAIIDNNKITITDYKRIWEKAIDAVPFEENKIKTYEQIVQAKFSIDENGKIISEEVPENYNDSTLVVDKGL